MFMSLGETRKRSVALAGQRGQQFLAEIPLDLDGGHARVRVAEPGRRYRLGQRHPVFHRVRGALQQALHERTARRGHGQCRLPVPEQPEQGGEPLGHVGELADEGGAIEYDAADVDARAEGLRGTRMGARRDVAVGIDDSQCAGRRGKAQERARRPGTDRIQHLGSVVVRRRIPPDFPG